MICSSVNLLFLIVRLLSGGDGLYPNLEEFAGLRSLAFIMIPQISRHGNKLCRAS